MLLASVVTLLTFQSNDRLGPVVTSSVSSTAPLFALVATYPLVTVFLSAAVLREEAPGLRGFVGVAVTVAAIAYLVAA